MSNVHRGDLPFASDFVGRNVQAESVTFQRALWQEKTAEALAQIEAAGVSILRPDKGPFVTATLPLYEQIGDSAVGRLAKRIREVK